MPKEDIAKRVCSGSTYHKRFQDMTMAWSISETVDQIIGNIGLSGASNRNGSH